MAYISCNHFLCQNLIAMEEVFMTQEEFDKSVKVGDEIETDMGERCRCIAIEDGVPKWEIVK